MDNFKSETIKSILPIITDRRDFIFLKKIDVICQKIETGEDKEILIKKAKDILGRKFPKEEVYNNTAGGNTEYGLEKNDRLDDLFFEILCFDYLEKNDFLEIKFVKTGKNKKPDFEAIKNEEVFYFESKCIHIPKKENHQKNLAKFDKNGIPEIFVNDVEDSFFVKNKIKEKFEKVFNNAQNKFKDSEIKKENRIILYNFEPSSHSIIKALDSYNEELSPDLKNKFEIGNVVGIPFN